MKGSAQKGIDQLQLCLHRKQTKLCQYGTPFLNNTGGIATSNAVEDCL
jgi:hypothetical protein